MNAPRRRISRKSQRGVALIWLALSLAGMVLISAYAIDISWLYFQRERIQAAADAASLAGDWGLMQGYSDSDAQTVAQQVLQSNGYTTAGGASITYNPHNGGSTNYTVSLTSPEPMFFGYTVSSTGMSNVQAAATATYDSVPPISGVSPAFYGQAEGGPIALVAYGPDQGDTRGDAVNTRWNDITGEYAKAPNPMNYDAATQSPLDTGQNYLITPASNYATLNPMGDGKIMVQIFDPQTSVTSKWNTKAVDQYVNTAGSTLSSSSTTGEKWIYSLYSQDITTGELSQNPIATATYGESNTNLEGNWVSPPGFVVDTSSYDLSNTDFVLNVKTGNPYVAGQTNALDKNGYMVRAGPDFDESGSPYTKAFFTDSNNDVIQAPGSGDPTNSLNPTGTVAANTATNNPKSYTLNNTILEDSNGSTTGSSWQNLADPYNSTTGVRTPLVSVAAENNLPITFYGNSQGTAQIYFGYLGANPNTSQASLITFNGFDEDSGATSITYTVSAPGQSYDGTTFTGVLGYQSKDGNGNGIWSSPGSQTRGVSNATTPSNTVYFPPGVYQGGTWTANYNTGSEDTSTWNWTVNWAGSPGSNNNLRLTSTGFSDY